MCTSKARVGPSRVEWGIPCSTRDSIVGQTQHECGTRAVFQSALCPLPRSGGRSLRTWSPTGGSLPASSVGSVDLSSDSKVTFGNRRMDRLLLFFFFLIRTLYQVGVKKRLRPW